MDVYVVGSAIDIPKTFRNAAANNALYDPPGLVARIRTPTGEQRVATLVRQSLGVFVATFVPDAGGVWGYAFAADGAAPLVVDGQVFVRPAAA